MRRLTLNRCVSLRGVPLLGLFSAATAAIFGLAAPDDANAQASCARTITADVVAFDQPLMYNRLGAQNVNAMMYALRHDVVDKSTNRTEAAGGVLSPGNVELRPDKRPRPLVVRVAAGDCLQVKFENLLDPMANPFNAGADDAVGQVFELQINNQVNTRWAGFHPQGLELVGDINSDSSFVGENANSLVDVGESATYTFYAPEEGTFLVVSDGATFGGEASGGNVGVGLFGAVNVQPKRAKIYRSQVTEEELRLATIGTAATGQPIVDYEARYPMAEPWTSEGKAGKPILNMLDGSVLWHSDINAIVMGDLPDGSFRPDTYPLESVGKRNPAYPNRLQPFREFASVWHDENAVAQAFDAWFEDPVLGHTLHGVRDSFMINYGSGGIGAEIIANRLGVGPMYDCLDCAYEEFFLTSFTVGDPAMLVDVPANAGLEACDPALNNCAAVGPKATRAFFPDDPANVHHSYVGDFVKFRNVHAGPKEQHVFHLHNHQWLFNPNDDNSNYLDAQGIGPGSGYTYEIANGGSGNRNKTSGDAIFHCHFYPHFAQGMWYMWRIHDTMEVGTRLAASGMDTHTAPFALGDGTPAAGARALPDGEIIAGTPIPAVVPLPGKAMAPMPGAVQVVAKDSDGDGIADSSQAQVLDRTKNPGYPFWIAGIEDIVGQRPPTPPLDMITEAEAAAAGFDPVHAGGFDGGLPRHVLDGYKAGGTSVDTQNRLDFSKVVTTAKPLYYPETGTDLEQVAMAFHAQRNHASSLQLPDGTTAAADFVVNGAPPVPGAPYNEPCVDDEGDLFLTGQQGDFFGGSGLSFKGSPQYGADAPRVYKGAVIQIDAVFNKVGYHFPQQRIITLWDDVAPTLAGTRPPEPFVIRLNTFDCAKFLHANLVPEVYELDDYQVRTPTDIIGQHIHLPKWDLTTADGAANGWNYEDGTLSPGMVRERIEAINHFNDLQVAAGLPPILSGKEDADGHLHPEPHPFFGPGPDETWVGARTTIQRWFADPLVNVQNVDRGLGIIFTHDHYGPSTHQQVGLYATVLVEPAGSMWVHNETGEPMYTRADGGPTSWQAAILSGDVDGDGQDDSYREFYFEYSDFQHAYEIGAYAGIGPDGLTVVPPTPDSFRNAINPSFRQQANVGGQNQPFPDLVRFPPFCPGGVPRPCPEAITADDPGMLVVNYRNEPVGLRVYDPNRIGPDGKRGTQAQGFAGDLAHALQSRRDRAIPALNDVLGNTPYPPLNADLAGGDPFTPMMRVNAGDVVRVKVQAGAHEHEHNVTVAGVKWLQAGSGFGKALNSGWRSAQNAGISEQFTFRAPIVQMVNQRGRTSDTSYAIDNSQDGWWSGVWGIMRMYNGSAADLFRMPNGVANFMVTNSRDFNGVCPKNAPVRGYDVTAVLVNEMFGNPVGATVPAGSFDERMTAAWINGARLDAEGGTLVYNPRGAGPDDPAQFNGPLHDPTAIVYVKTADLEPLDPLNPGCYDGNLLNPALATCPAKVKPGVTPQPLVIRAAAGDCIEVTVRNRLPGGELKDEFGNAILDPQSGVGILKPGVPDLAGYNTLLQVVNRDRNDPQGLTTFQNNLIQPSSWVGLQPQLVAYDVTRTGTRVGANPSPDVEPGGEKTFSLYAGDIDFVEVRRGVELVATPLELGASGLIPIDRVKQGQKGLVGALIVEPAGSSWVEDAGDPEGATVTRSDGTTLRDYAVVIQKGLNHRYGDGTAIPNIASEGIGIPEDSHDAGQQAVNYGTEPAWFRYGLPADADFGGALAAMNDAHRLYSNPLAGGDPATPVIRTYPGQETRLRVVEPTGSGRGTTFNVHGHGWQRDPYVCPTSADLGLSGKCVPTSPGTAGEIGSQALGDNPLGMWLGHQESFTPAAHFDVLLPRAGGIDAVPGDFLFRDQASFGNLSGVWGILRVGTDPIAGETGG